MRLATTTGNRITVWLSEAPYRLVGHVGHQTLEGEVVLVGEDVPVCAQVRDQLLVGCSREQGTVARVDSLARIDIFEVASFWYPEA